MIFNIQRYSTHDGPGIRTVVFLKGCSLGCRWCQNPESRSGQQEVLFDARLCMAGCDLCQRAVPGAIERLPAGIIIHRERLEAPHFAQLQNCCPTQALSVCGEAANVDSIMATVLRDKPFYQRSGGGITLSGGEPFMQPELARALLQRSRQQGIHTAVETCLHVPWAYVSPSLPYIDLFLADLKHVDGKIFKQWTGGSAKRVMENLRRVAASGKPLVIRVPLIPGFNADAASVRAITDFATGELGARDIHFLPYHTLGKNKYQLLNQPYLAADKPLDDPELLVFAERYASTQGLAVTLRG
ncbi:pyruvate formate lyase activating enzyme [Gibbsiella quercinecans]|uniref:Pyruvate formate lyase-activating protein n=1 Tax=Gibbsiella quercinecans TaxID=929813 RepID=A0A250B5V2_9GAMM|nr:glycyl-radical enzyme activating protein [Gibbsiella quercinecans]ATA21623.1 pyruvate formate lyase-activating protein [Gibbsiella quercinecans]RLM06082.1 pyruvate formate lyase-activating protein [Gibbsiella quercinecans]RLM06238.1 pyruvate formate lyase-activating protein [Gibbsiella quercinecans]RLM15245.1 pyruvate formate lyase-activating protein [Gibbsiella quercinecans]TCT88870.1 pyruvate formate lyase activating enzyme [Gibbsiella quercinecans]